MTVTPDKARTFTVNVRIPGWAREQPVPGDLYRFADSRRAQPTVKVNGAPVPLTMTDGYVAITRTWKAGRHHRSQSADAGAPHRRQRAGRGRSRSRRAAARPDRLRRRVARQPQRQGPQHRPARRERADGGVPRRPAERRRRGQGTRRRSRARRERRGARRPSSRSWRFPYATWANRGRGQMAVWLARTDAAAKPTPYPTVATTSTLTNSQSTKNIRNIIDGEDPRASNDSTSVLRLVAAQRLPRWRSQPRGSAGSAHGLQRRRVDRDGVREAVDGVRDRRSTGSTTPAAAACACRKAGACSTRTANDWKPVEAAGDFGVAKDAYNTVRSSRSRPRRCGSSS